MKILAPLTKLNQILYTYSVGPQKARNAKTNHPKWGWGSKMKILALWIKLSQILFGELLGVEEDRGFRERGRGPARGGLGGEAP